MSIEEELQLTKQKLTEKEQHIADLEKKVRLNEFKQKKLTSEMNMTLEAEKMKVKNAAEQVERLNTQNQDLQIKLTQSEQKSLKLMEELSKKRKNSDSSDEEQKSLKDQLMPRKSMIQNLGDINEIPSYTELIQIIQKYNGNEKQMAAELQRFHENVTETLSRKDNQIYALQEENRQMQESLLEIGKKVSDFAKQIAQKEEKIIEDTQLIENLKQQLDIMKQEKQEQYNELTGKLSEMNEQKGSNDTAVQDVQNQCNKTLMYQEEQYKKREQELIDQLQQNEDKQQYYDQKIQLVESNWKMEVKQIEENHKLVIQNKQQQIQQLQQQLIDDSNKFKDEQQKQINQLKQDYQNRIKSLEQTIYELNTTIEQDAKKIKKFELEKKRKDQDISDLQENCKLCEEQLQTLKDKSQQMIDQYENQIRELKQNNTEQQESKSVYDQRMSISSVEPNKSFEIDMLKAQIDSLKQKGDIQLQSEIAKLNEQERALKKEILDLQNDVGTERLNYTLNLRKLELQLEQLQLEVEHAQAEQVYAEQITAKISVQYANLAMEYENTKLLQRALETQKLMKYLLSILCSIFPILAVDLTTLYVDQQFLLNHTQLFQSQLQVDSDQKKPINPIQDQENEEGKMKQILFEQEEKIQKLLSNRKLESQGKRRNQDGEEISEDEIDDQSKLGWKKRTNSKLPKKQLQENYLDGNEADSIQSIQSIATEHKIVLTVFMITLISVFALMREFYGKGLAKWFRKTVWLIAVDNLQFLIVILIGIALYYNNYFDNFYLTNQTQRRYVRRDILLIEIQDYDEMYRINVYGYLLSLGTYNIILVVINILNAYVLNREGEIYKKQEEQWDQRQELAELHKDMIEQLVEKSKRYEQIIQLGGGENKEIRDLIQQMNKSIDELKPKLKYFILKLQFLQRIQPYFGPTHLRDDIDYWEYLSRSSANNLYIISQWNIKIVVLLLITLIIMTIETYLFSILITSIQFSFLIFYFIIDLNYRIDQIYAHSIIHANIEILEEEEMQQFPQMLDSVFEQNIPDKPVDPQIAHFPFKNEEYFVLSLNYIQKCSTLLIQISIIYIFDWSQLNKYLKSFALLLAILSWLSVIYISQRILIQYAIAMGMFNKQFELVEQIVKNKRTQLVKSCFSFFELIKFLRRSYQLDDIPKENLIMFRPIILDILEVCQQFESGKLQEIWDVREQVLQELGMQELKLIPIKNLVTILDRLGSSYSEQDLVYIDNFCRDQNPDYFSPNRLILYLQLRHQEIKLRSNEIIEQFFNITLPQIYGQIQPFNGHNQQNYKEQQLIGEVDIQELENFMLESAKSGLLDSTSIKPILQCIKRLKSKSVCRISEFISNQIAQMPV